MDSNRSARRAAATAVVAFAVTGFANCPPTWAREGVPPGTHPPSAAHLGVWRTQAKADTRKARRADTKERSKAFAFRLVTRRSWSGDQFQCLDSLWTRESNWDHRAHNAGSGAYGIPQALPGRKMRSAASDWRINPRTQIKWGLSYIEARYGSPCGAWGHFRSHNWY
ncbi:lytic transglycosylase domain-containing protein [Sphaerimonospora cavernae]|uniref:Lytic transglycosylase domain-containing protein n=1 Tax=Sphaerimonospora cavernae TaxID=1740611 RepID=A0ABV6U4S8_9ACTN